MDHTSVPFLQKEATSSIEAMDLPFPHSKPSNPHRHRSLYALLRAAAILLATYGLLAISLHIFTLLAPATRLPYLTQPDVYRPSTLPPALNLCSCGPDLPTALARSCTYDTLATAWLPPACRDEALTASFDVAGPGPDGVWTYYADESGTRALTRDEVGALGPMGGSFWATHDWHVAHCMWYWQKTIRMRDTGAVMERRFDSLAHVKHCGMLARKGRYVGEGAIGGGDGLIEVPVVMDSGVAEVDGEEMGGHEHAHEHKHGDGNKHGHMEHDEEKMA